MMVSQNVDAFLWLALLLPQMHTDKHEIYIGVNLCLSVGAIIQNIE